MPFAYMMDMLSEMLCSDQHGLHWGRYPVYIRIEINYKQNKLRVIGRQWSHDPNRDDPVPPDLPPTDEPVGQHPPMA